MTDLDTTVSGEDWDRPPTRLRRANAWSRHHFLYGAVLAALVNVAAFAAEGLCRSLGWSVLLITVSVVSAVVLIVAVWAGPSHHARRWCDRCEMRRLGPNTIVSAFGAARWLRLYHLRWSPLWLGTVITAVAGSLTALVLGYLNAAGADLLYGGWLLYVLVGAGVDSIHARHQFYCRRCPRDGGKHRREWSPDPSTSRLDIS